MANSAVVGMLRALLVADTAEFDAAMTRATDSAKVWSKSLTKIGKEASDVGRTLTAGLTLPLVGLAAGASKLAIDFESSFAGVRKTVDATEPELAKLSEQFRTLAKTIPVSVNEINKLAETAGALGVPKEAIAGFVEVMAGLGVATNLTADDAANAIARIQTIFGAAGKDTDRFAATLVGLGNAGASTEKEIVEMAQRIAGAGHALGLTEAQVLSISSAMAGLGINAEAGGSSMSRILTKMNQAVAAGGAELTKWAAAAKTSAADFKAAFEASPAEALTRVVEGLAQAGSKQATVVQGLVGKNTTLLDTFQRLSGAGDQLRKTLALGDAEWEKNSALTNETGKRYETVASQLTILWNKIQDVGITLGQALMPTLKLAMSAFDGLVPILESVVAAFAGLPAPVQALIIGFAGIAAAAGPALIFFGAMTSGLGTLVGAFKTGGIAAVAFAETMAFLAANPIVLVLAGLAALGVAIYAVATAESDLEKEVRTNTKAFADETNALDRALATYHELAGKQQLTKDETKRLEDATRLLAEASGLSAEGFNAEMGKSDALNRALQDQLKTRRDLVAFQIEAQQKKVREAQSALLEATEARNKILQGRGTVQGPLDPESGAYGPERAMTLREQAEAEQKLRKEIEAKTKAMEQERTLLAAMTGAKQGDINLTNAEVEAKKKAAAAAEAAAKKKGEAAEAEAESESKAEKKKREAFEATARAISEAGVADKIAAMNAQMAASAKYGGVAKESWKKYTQEIEAWVKAGYKVPPLLDDFRVEHMELLASQFKVKDSTAALLAGFHNYAPEILRAGQAIEDLYKKQDTFAKLVNQPGGLLAVLKVGAVDLKELWAPFEKARAEAAARTLEWAQTFGRMMSGLWSEIGAGFTDMLVGGMTGAQSFADGFVHLWEGVKKKLINIFADILNLFVNGLIRGMVGYAMGNQAAFSQAFAGLAGTGSKSLMSTVLGAGTSAGSGAALSTAMPGTAVAGYGGAGAAGGAGAGSAGLAGAAAGSLAGAGVGAAVGYYVGYHSGSTVQGAATGAIAGATTGGIVGGPVGMGVGAGVGALAGWYGAVKAGKDINKMRDAFSASQGSIEQIHARLQAMGREDLWKPFAEGPRNIGQFKEALGKVQEVLELTGKRDAFAETRGGLEALHTQLTDLGRADLWAAINDASSPQKLRQAVADLQAVFKATDEVMRKVGVSFGKLQTAASAYGRTLPADVRKALAGFLESKGITDEMRANLEALAKDPSWQELETRAKDLGIDLQALGTKFQTAKIHEIALGYVRDLTMFSDAGADMDAVLKGMSDELSTLYQNAKKNGVSLPETLRPWMERLAAAGLLVDENGQKITDLNGIVFDPEVKDQPLIDIKNVLLDIKKLLEHDLPEAANTAADGINAAFGRIRPPNIPSSGTAVPRPKPTPGGETPGGETPPGETPEPPGGGGAVPRPELGLQGGTHGQYVDWGAGTDVTLHGRERVMRAGEAIGGSGGAPIQITVISTLDGREVARNQIKYIPRELSLVGL
jgi:TP901 family phage tail tape measure protein